MENLQTNQDQKIYQFGDRLVVAIAVLQEPVKERVSRYIPKGVQDFDDAQVEQFIKDNPGGNTCRAISKHFGFISEAMVSSITMKALAKCKRAAERRGFAAGVFDGLIKITAADYL